MKNDESASNGGAPSCRILETRGGIERTDRTGAIEFIGVSTARKAHNSHSIQKRAQI